MEVCLASGELSCWLEKLMESYSLDKTKTKTKKLHTSEHKRHISADFACLSPGRSSVSVTPPMPKGRMVCPMGVLGLVEM